MSKKLFAEPDPAGALRPENWQKKDVRPDGSSAKVRRLFVGRRFGKSLEKRAGDELRIHRTRVVLVRNGKVVAWTKIIPE